MSQTPHATTRADSLRPVLLIVGALTLVRILYLVFVCPYSLVEDEAQYWLWAQHPAWSYYSKGPGIAWVIWLSTSLFGDAEWAVRISAALSAGVAALCVGGTARDIARAAGSANPTRIALFALAVFATSPVFQMLGLLMTIDGPYVACWAAACWGAWRALHERSRGAWVVLGLALGVGFVFKYTILLLAVGLVIYAIVRRRSLRVAPSAGPWILACVGLMLLGLAPVLIWNAQHDWATVRHLLGHVGAAGGDAPVAAGRSWLLSLRWPFELVGSQLIANGPALVLGLWGAWVWGRRGKGAPPPQREGVLFLLACGLPVMFFYLVLSLFAEPEGNWPIAGNVTLLGIGAWWISEWAAARRRQAEESPKRVSRRFTPARFLWHATIVYAVAAAVALHRADVVAAVATRVVMWPPVAWVVLQFGGTPKTIRPGRLMSGAPIGAHVAKLMGDLETQTGKPAFILADHYGRASQMAYYAGVGRGGVFSDGLRRLITPAPAYCASAVMGGGGRQSQFDVWDFTNLRDPRVIGELQGRAAVVLSNDKPETLASWRTMFDRVELISETGRLEGEHKRDRVAYFGYGFRGPPAAAPGADHP